MNEDKQPEEVEKNDAVAGLNERLVMRDWILKYIKDVGPVCATDELFHEAFYAEFGGARKETMWGAQPVHKAMLMLKKLYDDGTLDRSVMRLGINWQPGFPRWNYGYFLVA